MDTSSQITAGRVKGVKEFGEVTQWGSGARTQTLIALILNPVDLGFQSHNLAISMPRASSMKAQQIML